MAEPGWVECCKVETIPATTLASAVASKGVELPPAAIFTWLRTKVIVFMRMRNPHRPRGAYLLNSVMEQLNRGMDILNPLRYLLNGASDIAKYSALFTKCRY